VIKSREDRPATPIEIDLTGPQGNAFYLLGLAASLSRKIGHSEFKRECILREMRLTDYEGLLYTFDREFGMLVTLWR
jgi:hypothetical protein|tara:strand:- start:443 stop:673 length:231 start_codon:yes stop_codon:yes gene_type:complete